MPQLYPPYDSLKSCGMSILLYMLKNPLLRLESRDTGRFRAIEETSSDGTSDDEIATKESQEAEAKGKYYDALKSHSQENYEEAKKLYTQVLNSDFIKDILKHSIESNKMIHPAFQLKYAVHKNLGSIAEKQEFFSTAIDCYNNAIDIDDTDVSLWSHVGSLFIKINKFADARTAFQQGLIRNPAYRPCIDKLMTLLFAVGDYHNCLNLIFIALELSCANSRAWCLKEQIFKECPYLADVNQNYILQKIGISESSTAIDPEYKQQIIEEALSMRNEHKKLVEMTLPEAVHLKKPLASLTWYHLGQHLIKIYDDLQSLPDASMLTLIDLQSMVRPKKSNSKDNNESPTKETNTDGRKRKRIASEKAREPSTPEPKRRSKRVRTVSASDDQKSQAFIKELTNLIPKSLQIDINKNYDAKGASQAELKTNSGSEQKQAAAEQKGSSWSTLGDSEMIDESFDVREFIHKQNDHRNIIQILQDFIISLTTKWAMKWPENLTDIVLKVYARLRPHIILPSIFSDELDEQACQELVTLCLVVLELQLDTWLCMKAKSNNYSPSKVTPLKLPECPVTLPRSCVGDCIQNDITFIKNCVFTDRLCFYNRMEIAVRVLWAQARYMMHEGQIDTSLYILKQCQQIISNGSQENISDAPKQAWSITLTNCTLDREISQETVAKKIKSLLRCQSFDEVQQLFQIDEFEKVIAILELRLNDEGNKEESLEKYDNTIPERPAHFMLLCESYLKLKDYHGYIKIAEKTLHEIILKLNSSAAWKNIVGQLLNEIQDCLDQHPKCLKTLEWDKTVRFVQNIIQMIDLVMNTDSVDTSEVNVQPWICLNTIVRQMESERHLNENKNGNIDTAGNNLDLANGNQTELGEPSASHCNDSTASANSFTEPCIFQLLKCSHQYLGKKSWCCRNDGAFLFFAEKTFTELLDEYDYLKDYIKKEIEQCYYCLYGHPRKKSKAKAFEQHLSPQVEIKWENVSALFNFLKPNPLPNFNSPKTQSISLESLPILLTISSTVPTTDQIEDVAFRFNEYLSGNNESFSDGLSLVDNNQPTSILKNLYYVLADSFFKNFEYNKAIKYYTYDICYNWNHFDSWIGMALACKHRIESKLNNRENRFDKALLKHCSFALKCFEKATRLDDSYCLVWTEYGSLAYMMQAHTSRRMKEPYRTMYASNTSENDEFMIKKHKEMLELALKCFLKATSLAGDNDEKWFLYYMTGKCYEKLKMPPKKSLDLYLKAASRLHHEKADYPKKVTYSQSSQLLAVEAVEIHYRLFASMLKALENNSESQHKVIDEYVSKVYKLPFILAEEKSSKDSEKNMLDQDRVEKITSAKNETAKSNPIHSRKRVKEEDSDTNDTRDNDKNLSAIRVLREHDYVENACRATINRRSTITRRKSIDKKINITSPVGNQSSIVKHQRGDTNTDCLDESVSLTQQSETVELRRLKNIELCLKGISICLDRCSFSYKSVYRLASTLFYSSVHKDITLCRSLLLGWSKSTSSAFPTKTDVQFNIPKYSIFCLNKANFFSSMYKNPVEDFERAGGFCAAINKSLLLLLKILAEVKDISMIFTLSGILDKKPQDKRKYMKDVDRCHLAKKAYLIGVGIVSELVDQLEFTTSGDVSDEKANLPKDFNKANLTSALPKMKELKDKFEDENQVTETLLAKAEKLLSLASDKQPSETQKEELPTTSDLVN
ncbi:Calcineurin-binding protein cabin-1 [Trichoplax sp. H2]|nr:Calcineurin-binding protein cabin-1 [Trichoplax sp. H2]|eukprot:RDD44975.1 Calcineurin-binding protein cabin-1 [Trichoplax sp. H2]